MKLWQLYRGSTRLLISVGCYCIVWRRAGPNESRPVYCHVLRCFYEQVKLVDVHCFGTQLQEHKAVCKYMVVPCPNSAYGCPSRLSKVDMRNHMITKCRFRPVQCTWCLKNVLDEQVIASFHIHYSIITSLCITSTIQICVMYLYACLAVSVGSHQVRVWGCVCPLP